MKKFSIIVLTFVCLFLVGCGSKELDLSKVSENLDNLTTEEFSLLTAAENIEFNSEYFEEELVNIYDFDLEKMGINSELISEMSFKVKQDNKPAYIIVKPVDGKKKELKQEIDAYLDRFDDLNKLEKEHEGYLIYLFTDKNEEILKTIKNSKEKVFGMLMEVTDEDLEALTGVKVDDVDEFLVKNSVMTQASSYFILKPTEGKKDAVKDAMDKYMETLEENWKTYLPDQYELVKNRLEEEYGDYLVYIISTDNELVYKTIKK